MEIEAFNSAAEFEQRADDWNDLWLRSHESNPTARAEFLSAWHRQFDESGSFRVYAVSNGRRWLAALPLVSRPHSETVPVRRPTFGRLPRNFWSAPGTILIEAKPQTCTAAAQTLSDGLRLEDLEPIMLLKSVPVGTKTWTTFADCCRRSGLATVVQSARQLDLTRLNGDFDGFLASRSRNFRRNLKRRQRLADENGGVGLEVIDNAAPSDVRDLMERGFAIEHRSWKGSSGTSVLASPGMLDYFVNEATMLAQSGELVLFYLHYQQRPVAFQYAYRNGDRYYLPKTGYDEAYADIAPGHLLTLEMMKYFARLGREIVVDYAAETSAASAPWATESIELGHLALSNRPIIGRALVRAFGLSYNLKQRARGRAA